MKSSCVIVDDEIHARELLEEMLKDVDPEMEVLATCDDLPSAVKAINKYKPQIVFLDIEMPGQSGLELLEYFNEDEINFEIVFTTGYSEYAIEAFKLSAADYLLKPLDVNSLRKTLNRICKQDFSDSKTTIQSLKNNLVENQASEKIISIHLSNHTRFVKLKDIKMLQAEGSYCKIFLNDNTQILASKNLKHFEEKLQSAPFFFRSHKSYIVNLKTVKEIQKSENELRLEGNIVGLISNERFEMFLECIENL